MAGRRTREAAARLRRRRHRRPRENSHIRCQFVFIIIYIVLLFFVCERCCKYPPFCIYFLYVLHVDGWRRDDHIIRTVAHSRARDADRRHSIVPLR